MYMIGKIIILNIMKRGKQQIFKYTYMRSQMQFKIIIHYNETLIPFCELIKIIKIAKTAKYIGTFSTK